MSSTTGEQEQVAGPAPRSDVSIRPREPEEWSRWERRCDRVRWVLAVSVVLFAAVTVIVGVRESPWRDLKRAVASGDVDTVQILGERPADQGGAFVQVRWRHGIVDHVTDVVQVRDRPPSQVLQQLQPDLRVEPRFGETLQPRWTIYEFSVPGWFGPIAVLIYAALLGLVTVGPQPWRATRPAWAWLCLLAPPVGLFGFLLLSGPTPGLPRPRDPARRLTGGWAFLLALVLGGGSTRA